MLIMFGPLIVLGIGIYVYAHYDSKVKKDK